MGRVKSKRIVTPRIVMPRRGPNPWLVLVLLSALGAWTWQSYDFGRQRAGYDSNASAERIAALKAQVRALKDEREDWLLATASQERSSQIDRDAVRQAQEEIRQLQDQRASLRRHVVFLQQLLAASEGPIRIRELQLEPEGEHGFRYRFTVARAEQEQGHLEGEIRVTVRGKANGAEQLLPLEELTEDRISAHKMRFRHFQRVEGKLTLPDDFSPQAFVVEVVPSDKSEKTTQRAFKWQVGGA